MNNYIQLDQKAQEAKQMIRRAKKHKPSGMREVQDLHAPPGQKR